MKTQGIPKSKIEDLDSEQVKILEILGESFTPLLKSLDKALPADNSRPNGDDTNDGKTLLEQVQDASDSDVIEAERERLYGQWLLAFLKRKEVNELNKAIRCEKAKGLAARAIDCQKEIQSRL